MVDINKIRNNELTEDEKMELIADYLEQGGGGGGSSDEVVLNIRNLVAPTSMSELLETHERNDFQQYVYTTTSFTVEDNAGNELSAQNIVDLVDSGKKLIMGELPYQGGFIQRDGDNITGIIEIARNKRLATNTAIGDSSLYPDLPEGGKLIALTGYTLSQDGSNYYINSWGFAVQYMPGTSDQSVMIISISFPK